RLGAEIADAGLNHQTPVRLDDDQAVEPHRSRRVRADGDADPACLRADAFAAGRFPLLPPEQLRAFVERLLEERARDVVLLPARVERAERRLAFRRVDAMNRDFVDAELPR